MATKVEDVIVIGSGFGGSAAAARLAEGGVGVTLMERGPWRDTVPVRSMGITERTPFPRGWRLYTDFLRTLNKPILPGGRVTTNRHGLMELFYSKGLEVVCSSGVGGGSHIYSAVHRRPADEHFWDGHCDGLSEKTMAQHYTAFLDRMGSTMPGPDNRPPNGAPERYHNHLDFEPAAFKAETRVGFLLPEDPSQPRKLVDENGIERWQTDYADGNNGFLGSPSGAKSTLDVCYLAPAMKKGLAVRDMCEVHSITRLDDGPGRYRVDFKDHHGGGKQAMHADNVIVAAGTMNTLRILLVSRDVTGGLSGMPNLGKRFSANGDVRGFWDENEPGTDQSTGLPSKGGIVLRGAPEPRVVIGRNSMPSVDSYPFPKAIRERIKRGMVVSSTGVDAMDGVINIKRGKLDINFDPSGSPIFARIEAAMKEIAERSGRKIYITRRPSTVHPMGGACLGNNADDSVVGATGEVHGHPGLFVADAAAFPAPTAAPPTLSIAAWGENIAKRFIDAN